MAAEPPLSLITSTWAPDAGWSLCEENNAPPPPTPSPIVRRKLDLEMQAREAAVERVCELTRVHAACLLTHDTLLVRATNVLVARRQRALAKQSFYALRHNALDARLARDATATKEAGEKVMVMEAAEKAAVEQAVAHLVETKQQHAAMELANATKFHYAISLLGARAQRVDSRQWALWCFHALWRHALASRVQKKKKGASITTPTKSTPTKTARTDDLASPLASPTLRMARLVRRDADLRVELKHVEQRAMDAEHGLAAARERIAALEKEVEAAKAPPMSPAGAPPSRELANRSVSFYVSQLEEASASVVSQSDDGSSSSTTADKAVEEKATAPLPLARHVSWSPDVRTRTNNGNNGDNGNDEAEGKAEAALLLHSTTGKENAGAARARLARMSPEERRLLWIRHYVHKGMLQEALDLGWDGGEWRPKRPKRREEVRPGGEVVHYV